jgi:hypothetical protein
MTIRSAGICFLEKDTDSISRAFRARVIDSVIYMLVFTYYLYNGSLPLSSAFITSVYNNGEYGRFNRPFKQKAV